MRPFIDDKGLFNGLSDSDLVTSMFFRQTCCLFLFQGLVLFMPSCIEDWAKEQGIHVGAVKSLEKSELRGIQAASSISPGDLIFSVPVSSAILLSAALKRCIALESRMIL